MDNEEIVEEGPEAFEDETQKQRHSGDDPKVKGQEQKKQRSSLDDPEVNDVGQKQRSSLDDPDDIGQKQRSSQDDSEIKDAERERKRSSAKEADVKDADRERKRSSLKDADIKDVQQKKRLSSIDDKAKKNKTKDVPTVGMKRLPARSSLDEDEKEEDEQLEPDEVAPGDLKRRPTLEFQKKLERIFNDGAVVKHEQRQRIVRPRLQFFNTYQLDPSKVFARPEVERCIDAVLRESFEDKKYSSKTAADLTSSVAEVIRNRVLEFGYDRYKIVVIVSIGPKGRQGVEIGMQCLWDSNRDRYAHGSFESYHVFASACVYGIYFD